MDIKDVGLRMWMKQDNNKMKGNESMTKVDEPQIQLQIESIV